LLLVSFPLDAVAQYSPAGTADEARLQPGDEARRSQEIDNVVGKGTGAVVTALFFKPQPPRGVGFPCANTDTFSYVQVHVTSASLTLTPKDSQGTLLQDAGLGPCGPFTIPAR